MDYSHLYPGRLADLYREWNMIRGTTTLSDRVKWFNRYCRSGRRRPWDVRSVARLDAYFRANQAPWRSVHTLTPPRTGLDWGPEAAGVIRTWRADVRAVAICKRLDSASRPSRGAPLLPFPEPPLPTAKAIRRARARVAELRRRFGD